MTIAISLKVHDGLVLAADSASTLFATDKEGKTGVVKVFNSASKVVNLYKGLPIGCITWGAGSIGLASVATLAKDFRRLLMSEDDNEFRVDTKGYTIRNVANAAREFFFERAYKQEFAGVNDPPALGLIVAGYSAGEDLAEEWRILIEKGECGEPQLLRAKDACGINWNGEPEAITRLILGHGTGLANVLKELDVPEEQIAPAIGRIEQRLHARLIWAPMPIQEAIDLADFLIQLTIMYSRFGPGAPTVGGPIEVAAITKHEGFKWIRRKFYYDQEYNPREG